MKHISPESKKRLITAAILTAVLGIGMVVPWQLVAQNTPPAAPVTVPASDSNQAAAQRGTTPALALPQDEVLPPEVPAKPSVVKRKRPAAAMVPVAPRAIAPLGEREEISPEDGDVLSVQDVKRGQYITGSRSKVGQAQESNESRDQVLRYKLIFKSGLARLRLLLNQQLPDESDVDTAQELVAKLEHQLVELSNQADNRDLASMGKVIQEQLKELNAAVGAATSEKTAPLRAKRLTRAKAIVEGLTEVVSDVDALGAKSYQGSAVSVRVPPGYGAGYGIGGSATAR